MRLRGHRLVIATVWAVSYSWPSSRRREFRIKQPQAVYGVTSLYRNTTLVHPQEHWLCEFHNMLHYMAELGYAEIHTDQGVYNIYGHTR